MRQYIIRRLLVMIPTLFGVTLVSFGIMQLAPGDPLSRQLGQSGSQGESSVTREAYLLQRRQWKLDRPTLLNIRWFQDYGSTVHHCARFRGMSEKEIAAELERLASGGGDPATLAFLRDLDIERFDERLRDPELRARLAHVVEIAVQIRIENLGDHAVRPLVEILSRDGDTALKIGAIRSLSSATLGSPFTYTYSKTPSDDETDDVVGTWTLWWTRASGTFADPAPDRKARLEEGFAKLVAEPSRGKIMDGISAFTAKDAPFFIGKLSDGTTLKEKYVATLALRLTVGKPLRVDVTLGDPKEAVAPVAENWIGYYENRKDHYSPGLGTKVWRFFTDTQYANSLVKLLTFNFGRAMVAPHDPVGPKIWSSVLVSAPLMLLSQLLIYLIAIPSGVACAVRRGRLPDRVISLTMFLLYSIPNFVAGMVFLTIFSYGKPFEVFPMVGLQSEGMENASFVSVAFDYLWHIFLPVVCLSIFSLAALAMYGRTSMLDALGQDYVRTGRAKGLSERTVIYRHGLRNALIPIITLFSYFIPLILGGSVLIEVIFSIRGGMGYLSYDSILSKDYNTLMALIWLDALIVMGSILLTDILYVLVDPRISFGGAGGQE